MAEGGFCNRSALVVRLHEPFSPASCVLSRDHDEELGRWLKGRYSAILEMLTSVILQVHPEGNMGVPCATPNYTLYLIED